MNKQHPILFSTEMVEAILDGRKTQTRRVVKPQPKTQHRSDTRLQFYARRGENWEVKDKWAGDGFSILDSFKCPYGKPGDILWVRETWASLGSGAAIEYGFKAGASDDTLDAMKFYSLKWKPSIHMPKAACRLFLRITKVRVERLHEISDTDVMNEGAQDSWFTLWELTGKTKPGLRPGFERLWSKINGAESWQSNPWVWVVEFERVSREEVDNV